MIKDVLTIAKTMKLPNISVTPNIILGSDDNFCMVSSIQIPSDIPRNFSASIKELLSVDNYNILINDSNILVSDMAKNNYDKLSDDYYINIATEPVLEYNIRTAFNHAIDYMNNSELVIDSYDAGESEEFREILSMKVSDGHAFYTINNFLLSFYGSLISANKTDKVIISIYKRGNLYNEPPTILAKCDVEKKKYTISNYIKYRLI